MSAIPTIPGNEVRENFDRRACLRAPGETLTSFFTEKRGLGQVVGSIVFGALLSGIPLRASDAPFPPFYHSAAPFRAAIDGVRTAPLDLPPSGVTVPHHALVLDLIAETLSLARSGDYERIVLISPDHFRRTETAAAVATRDFLTVLGPVPTDQAASLQLAGDPLISVSSLASHEHGFRAILPFLAEWFPGVPVVTVAVGIRTKPDDWRGLADALVPVITEKTLVIQSTDFSHYLTPEEARAKDAETLTFIALGGPNAVVDLNQPDHIDSKAAQWIQMTLQQRRGASVAVVNNRNSAQYATDGEVPRETTSYISQVWRREAVPAALLPGEAWYFGGDFHLGRGLAKIAEDPSAVAWLEERMRSLTGGRPLILNLEGVLVEAPPDPATLHPMQIVMPTEPTLDLLKRWNVAGVVLANNHSLDLGPEALTSMAKRLRDEGFTVLGEGEVAAFPGFDLFAASDVRNRPEPAQQVLRIDDFPVLSGSTSAFPHLPRLAFLHWGAEYREGPDERQRWLAGAVAKAGFDLLIGCHAHVPSPATKQVEGILTLPTLGNLLFDQSQRERGGVLLELRFFEQGTFATRVIPVGNLYREWRGR